MQWLGFTTAFLTIPIPYPPVTPLEKHQSRTIIRKNNDRKMAMGDLGRFILLTVGIAGAITMLIVIAALAIRWARKGSPGAAFAGWALLLLSAGMNPQPPPQEHVEEATRRRKIKKDAESGDDEVTKSE
jgi:hypothetical protein